MAFHWLQQRRNHQYSSNNLTGLAKFRKIFSSPHSFLIYRYTTKDGTAKANDDYTPLRGTLVFPPEIKKQQIKVPLLDDYDNEKDETITLKLSIDPKVTDCYLGNQITTTVTIKNDDRKAYFNNFVP